MVINNHTFAVFDAVANRVAVSVTVLGSIITWKNELISFLLWKETRNVSKITCKVGKGVLTLGSLLSEKLKKNY